MEASQMKKTLEELVEECLKCPTCSKPFDKHTHIPRFYPCMHSTCEGCLSMQFIRIDIVGYAIRCPLCDRVYSASSPPDISSYKINTTLISVIQFISSKEKLEFCEKCSQQLSEAFCRDCELSLCRACIESIHIGNNSNHNVKYGIKRQDIPIDACRMCLNQSDIYCSTCKVFFCYTCEDMHHNEKSARTHEVIQFNEDDEEKEGLPGKVLRVIVMFVKGVFHTITTVCRPVIRKLLPWMTVANTVMAFLLMLLVLLGTYIKSLPAYTLLPFNEVEPVNMICRHGTKEELHQNQHVSKIEFHRTLCTFNVFHYDLRNRNKTYFVLDIDIDIANIHNASSIGKLFTIKMFHLDETDSSYHMQRSKYWSVSWCKNRKDICLDVIDYKKETIVAQNIIGNASVGENKTVSFLFVVDNNRKVMEFFSTEILLKDDVSLKRYYKEQSLSVWISLVDPKNEKYMSARIRNGGNITIGDLPNPSIFTDYETAIGVLTYPFRYLISNL